MRLRRKKWAKATIARHLDTALSLADLKNDLTGDCLEIGSGRGLFLLTKAQTHPEQRFIGVEVNYNAFSLAIKRTEDPLYARETPNYLFINAPWEKVLPRLKPDSLSAIYLNFPDPWPKKRQYKRRLTFPNRLKEYYGLLQKNGRLFFKTDNEELFAASKDYFATAKQFKISYSGAYETVEADDVMTEFESKFRRMGRPIYRLIAVKE